MYYNNEDIKLNWQTQGSINLTPKLYRRDKYRIINSFKQLLFYRRY